MSRTGSTGAASRHRAMALDGGRLADVAPLLQQLLTRGRTPPFRHGVAEIAVRRVDLAMRDGARLATDLYLPPQAKAPTIVMRTPYDRAHDKLVGAFHAFARRGYAVVAQDCRGTGASEPDHWDYYVHESEDGYDCIQWLVQQDWYDGFVGSAGGSYAGQTQWCMAMHPAMTTIVPEVSGLGLAVNTAHLYMNMRAYALSVGKGSGKSPLHHHDLERVLVEATLAGGLYNDPLRLALPPGIVARVPGLDAMTSADAGRALWRAYVALDAEGRAAFIRDVFCTDAVTAIEVETLSALFGQDVPHDALTLPHEPRAELPSLLHAPPLMITGWYDWGLNDALATWEAIQACSPPRARIPSRLIITPAAHNATGYREGFERHPELQHNHRTTTHLDVLLAWYDAVRDGTVARWPKVIYYLMGANEWRTAPAWPPPEAQPFSLFLTAEGGLALEPPAAAPADSYVYDPLDPTPTVGGSIVSAVYPAGSVDVSGVQNRQDVLVYTTRPLASDLDVAGPIRAVIYVSSTAPDTDFSVRLSDVFPDGRAIQIQTGFLRCRFRNPDRQPEPMVPGAIYRLEIDMWATANRFRAGHRLRVDISSADFPRFDRNANLAGAQGAPQPATQTVHHDVTHASALILSALGNPDFESRVGVA